MNGIATRAPANPAIPAAPITPSPVATKRNTEPLRARGIAVDYDGKRALTDVTVDFEAGSTTALIGPNGAGKTTLLHALAGIISPAAGTVQRPPNSAYMPHHHGIGMWMPLTVREVISMGRYRVKGLFRPLRAADRQVVAHAAEQLEVDDLLSRQFGDLSTGQRQRVLMAQALSQQGDVLLLDEPITGLDMVSQNRILEVIDSERARGVIILLSTHHLDEARHCDRVVLLAGGCLVAQGPPPDVLTAAILAESYGGRMVHAGEDCEHPPERALVLDDHGHGHGDHDESAHAHDDSRHTHTHPHPHSHGHG